MHYVYFLHRFYNNFFISYKSRANFGYPPGKLWVPKFILKYLIYIYVKILHFAELNLCKLYTIYYIILLCFIILLVENKNFQKIDGWANFGYHRANFGYPPGKLWVPSGKLWELWTLVRGLKIAQT